MSNTSIPHTTPKDLQKVLSSNAKVLANWKTLTPLARNEWICWVISVKKEKTREEHLERLRSDLLNGKRRPCCWAGCPHREKTGR